MLTSIFPCTAWAYTTWPITTKCWGAAGFIFVSLPAVVGLKYSISPSDQVSPCNEPVVFI